MTKVYVLSGEHPELYKNMFTIWGYTIVEALEGADLVVFTGGADVHPDLYEQPTHPSVHPNTNRDIVEKEIFSKCISDGIPMVGVCRGAQFLNVMSGGSLYQDVDGHDSGSHVAIDLEGLGYLVSSTHHQMMIPDSTLGEVLLTGVRTDHTRVSNTRLTFDPVEDLFHDPYHKTMPDVEAVFYGETNCLCFQPHPEYFDRHHECQKLFFELLGKYLHL